MPYTAEQISDTLNLVMSCNPYFGKIACIGMQYNEGVDVQTESYIGTEEEILKRFWKTLNNFKGLFVSFNGLAFDVPFIIKRSMKLGLRPTNNDFLNLKRFSFYPHFDVKMVMADFDKYAVGTLKLICDYLNVPSPKEGEVKANQVNEFFLAGKIDLIAEYCLRDVAATYKIYDIVRNYVHKLNYKG